MKSLTGEPGSSADPRGWAADSSRPDVGVCLACWLAARAAGGRVDRWAASNFERLDEWDGTRRLTTPARDRTPNHQVHLRGEAALRRRARARSTEAASRERRSRRPSAAACRSGAEKPVCGGADRPVRRAARRAPPAGSGRLVPHLDLDPADPRGRGHRQPARSGTSQGRHDGRCIRAPPLPVIWLPGALLPWSIVVGRDRLTG